MPHPTPCTHLILYLLIHRLLSSHPLLLFHRASNPLCLAVLFPYKLAVFVLSSAAGGAALEAAKMFEHNMERPAANMACGWLGAGAGGSMGAEQICVQSMDGLLSFFDQVS